MAHTLDSVIAAALTGTVSDMILPVDSIFAAYPSIIISENEVKKAKNGAKCKTSENIPDGKYRVYASDGEFLLFGDVKNNCIETIKNFFHPLVPE